MVDEFIIFLKLLNDMRYENTGEGKMPKSQEKQDVLIRNDSLEKFAENNFYTLRNLSFVSSKIEELNLQLEKKKMLGVLDVEKISKNIIKFEVEKRKLLDLLLEQLEVSDGQKIIPNNEDLNSIFEELFFEKEEGGNFHEEESYSIYEEEEEYLDENIEEEIDDTGDFESIPFSSMLKERIKELDLEKEENGKIKEAYREERIKEMREKISSSYKRQENLSEFDPQIEFLRVKNYKFTYSNKDEFKIHFSEFKEKLNKQMLGIAELNADMEEVLYNKENFDINEIDKVFNEKSEIYKLSYWQKERYNMVLDEIKEAYYGVEQFLDNNKNKSSKEIFENIAGGSIDNEVVIERLPMAIVFHLFNFHDFAKFAPGDIEESETTLGTHIPKKMSGGLSVILVNRSMIEDDDRLREVVDHEYRHAIDDCIETSEINIDLKFDKLHDPILRLTENTLGNAADIIKKEVFAYMKGGTEEIFDIYVILVLNGGYDYMNIDDFKSKFEDKEELRKFDWKEIEKICEFQNIKFRKCLMDALVAVYELSMFGYSKEKIIGLLQDIPLDKWKKNIERILSSNAFREQIEIGKGDIIKERLRECDDTIRRAESIIKPSIFKMFLNKIKKDREDVESEKEYYETIETFEVQLRSRLNLLLEKSE